MAPRFRADQIGSLLRPQHLLDAQHAVYSSGSMHNSYNASQDAIDKYENIIKETIKEVVAQQRQHGVLPITSGEFERSSFVAGFFEKLEGIDIRQIQFEGGFRTKFAVQKPYEGMGMSGRDEPVAAGKVKWKEVGCCRPLRMVDGTPSHVHPPEYLYERLALSAESAS